MSTTPTIAIVDNFPRWRSFLDEYLSKEGFTTFCKAQNGLELLQHLEQADRLPDLCILDSHLYVMDGYETAARLRDLYPSIKILGFSMRIGRTVVNRMLNSGVHAFVPKGAAPQDILAALRKLLETAPEVEPNTSSHVAPTRP